MITYSDRAILAGTPQTVNATALTPIEDNPTSVIEVQLNADGTYGTVPLSECRWNSSAWIGQGARGHSNLGPLRTSRSITSVPCALSVWDLQADDNFIYLQGKRGSFSATLHDDFYFMSVSRDGLCTKQIVGLRATVESIVPSTFSLFPLGPVLRLPA